MTDATQQLELVPDAMVGLILAPDFLVKRIVGTISVAPQSASTSAAVYGFAIFRSVHNDVGARETDIDPLSTDVDSGSRDILWQKQERPNFGAQLTATALDLSVSIELDLRGRPTLRKLNKQNGIQLAHAASADDRLEFTIRLRILGALSI